MAAADDDEQAAVEWCCCGAWTSPGSPCPCRSRCSGQRARAADAAAGSGERVLDLPRGVSGTGCLRHGVSPAAASPPRSPTGRAVPPPHIVARADLGELESEFARGLTHDAAVDLIHAAHHLGDDALFDLVVSSVSKSLDKSAARAYTF